MRKGRYWRESMCRIAANIKNCQDYLLNNYKTSLERKIKVINYPNPNQRVKMKIHHLRL